MQEPNPPTRNGKNRVKQCLHLHVTKSLVLLFLRNISWDWHKMFSVRFWTFIACRSYSSPFTFHLACQFWQTVFGKIDIYYRVVFHDGGFVQILCSPSLPQLTIPSTQPPSSVLFQSHCVLVVVLLFHSVSIYKRKGFGSASCFPDTLVLCQTLQACLLKHLSRNLVVLKSCTSTSWGDTDQLSM